MSTITKQAVQAVADLKAGYTLGHADVAIMNELARIALASLEAEPVAYIIHDADARSRGEKGILRYFANISDEDINEYEITVTPLYAAPPVPVSVPVAWEWFYYKQWNVTNDPERAKDVADGGVEVFPLYRRAAMLQGAENAGSTTTMHTAPALDSSQIIAESTSGKSPVIPDWQAKAEKMAELHGRSFVVFRNGESPQCADPAKVIISFTDEGLGHGSAAPLQEAKNV